MKPETQERVARVLISTLRTEGNEPDQADREGIERADENGRSANIGSACIKIIIWYRKRHASKVPRAPSTGTRADSAPRVHKERSSNYIDPSKR